MKRANPFQKVCSFRFDDICKTVRVDSGCAYGKRSAITPVNFEELC